MLAAEVRPCREFLENALGYRLYERIQLEDGSEQGAWLSVSIAAHELIYVADAYGATGRLHHLAFGVDTREDYEAFVRRLASASRHVEPMER